MTGELLPHHAEILKASAISDDVVRDRGYWSASKPGDLNSRFSGQQKRPGLVIPVLDVYGEEAFCQLRPDDPREQDGKPIKYETPAKVKMALDVPPSTRPHLRNPKVTLWITEGIRKADALASVGLTCDRACSASGTGAARVRMEAPPRSRTGRRSRSTTAARS